MLKLVMPSVKNKESFLEGVKEIQAVDTNDSLREMHINELNFDEALERYRKNREGIDLPDDRVPSTVYWLVENDVFIGRVSIRHKLNEDLKVWGGHIGYIIRPSKREKGYGCKILELALPKAKELGINKALMTCDKDNIASQKIIEKNGGVFDSEYLDKPSGIIKLRYWINL